jgi:hypothetical protein
VVLAAEFLDQRNPHARVVLELGEFQRIEL